MTALSSPMAPSFFRRLRESLELLFLAVTPQRGRASRVYNVLGTHNNLAESSLYLNLGYWNQGNTYDEACRALALKLGSHAGLKPDHFVIDAGCGFGDAAVDLTKHFKLGHVSALNVTASQVAVAQRRFALPNVDFFVGSACAMPFANHAYDAVLALESSFHFPDRPAFFREALRVLKPGGTLAVADFFPRKQKIPLSKRIAEWVGRAMWQIPSSNWIHLDVCLQQLRDLGFTNIRVEDVSPHVFKPFKAYARERVKDPEVAARLHPLLRKAWGSDNAGLQSSDYVLIAADAPRSIQL